MKKILWLFCGLGFVCVAHSQDKDSIKPLEEVYITRGYPVNLDNVTISVSKWEQSLNEVPNKVSKISRAQIQFNNPQTAADMLAQSGNVFVQKSQLGGGSPMIRGFATNRVLMVVDGVRMNNAIYRSGNLQNVISIDPLSLSSAEVIFGPGSLVYGSDAIGGVMDFHTLEPTLSVNGKLKVHSGVMARYSSANKENTGHAHISLGTKKWAFLGSYTYSDFDDQKMGKHNGQDSYLRPEYVERINNTDSIVKNADPRVQKFTGYKQTNFLGKLRFKPSEHVDLQYHFTYAGTDDVPRYDRLIQYRNGRLRFAEWNYGPMNWMMHSIHALISKKTAVADQIKVVAAYQDYEESRIDRTRAAATRNIQSETIKAYNVNIDAAKQLGNAELFYGLEVVQNKVGSTGEQVNITNGTSKAYVSRYPNGSKWGTAGIYASTKFNLSRIVTVNGGLRYSYNKLDASFDTTFIKFPYKSAKLRDGALTGNAGLVIKPADTWQINGNISTGYRMPNVDDIGKLFESTPGNLTVPNPDLTPEYAWNFEVGIVKNIPNKLRVELTGFHTILDNAIVRRPFKFNGQDSILFAGSRSRVEALQNVARATVWGAQAVVKLYLHKTLYIQSNANYITGKETDDTKNEQVTLRHAAPFYGSTHLHYAKNKVQMELYSMYSSEIAYKDLAPSEQAKTDIYAKDAAGLPYSPSWHTFNLKGAYKIDNMVTVSAGWENITNQRYRPYSSGIVAAGSNVIISAMVNF